MSKMPKMSLFDPQVIRKDFPILSQEVNGKPLIYFDSAASSQKPRQVIEAVERFYSRDNANIHRGVHVLSQRATEAYEESRKKLAKFIGAKSSKEIVFVRGGTEAINLLASCLSQTVLKKGDRVLVSEMEHHANIVPWQLLEDRIGIELKIIPVTDLGEIDINIYQDLLKEFRPRLVGLVHISNSLGTINPVKEMTQLAHEVGAQVLIDGAQSVAHGSVDVVDLDCDYFSFSGHKMFGPTGIGVLYGKEELLNSLPPYQGGGDMIERVSFGGTTFKNAPERFEAGTPNIAGVIGLGVAVDYLNNLDREAVLKYEASLLSHAEEQLKEIEGLMLIGCAKTKASVCSFILDSAHSHDIGSFLDAEGIAIRTGHHCTQPLMERFGIAGTSRASLSFYNTKEEIDKFVEVLKKIKSFFG